MPHKFAGKVERSTKRGRGKTPLEQTPIAIRSSTSLPRGLETKIRSKLARRIGHAAPMIERGTVRFEDINGPRGGVDTVCRIKLVISGRPSVQVQERATDAEPAFDLASHKVQRVLERERGKHGLTTGKRQHTTRGHQRTTTVVARTAAAKTTRTAHAKTTRTAPKETARTGAGKRGHQPPERKPMKMKTARQSPSRRKAKSGANRAKRQHRVQRGARR